jgi:hypothetical protein
VLTCSLPDHSRRRRLAGAQLSRSAPLSPSPLAPETQTTRLTAGPAPPWPVRLPCPSYLYYLIIIIFLTLATEE